MQRRNLIRGYRQLTVWEDAADKGYVARETIAGSGLIVTVTEDGENLLRVNGRIA